MSVGGINEDSRYAVGTSGQLRQDFDDQEMLEPAENSYFLFQYGLESIGGYRVADG